MNLFDLMAKITLDTSEYENKLSESEDKGKSFGDSLKTGFATAGKISAAAIGAVAVGTAALGKTIVGQTKDLASYGDHIDKTSQKMGISAQAYQEWDAIMQHSGTTIDGMQRGLMTLSNKALAGSKAFDTLGISQESVASMSKEDLFSAVITGLQGMEDNAERAALAQELLGTAAKELGPLLNTSAEETQAMRDRVHELGGVMSDEAVKASAAYQDSLQDMNTSISGLKRGIVSNFLPGVTSVMDGLASIFSGDSGSGTAQVTDGISDMLQKITEGMPKIMQIGGQILSGIGNAIMQNLPMLIEQGTQILIMLATGIIQSLPMLVQAGFTILSTLTSAIASAIPTIIPVVIDVIMAIFDAVVSNAPLLINAAINLAFALINGLVSAIPVIVSKIPEIVEAIVNAIIENAPMIINAALELVTNLVTGLVSAWPAIKEAGANLFNVIKNAFMGLVSGASNMGRNVVTNIKNGISSAWSSLSGFVGTKFSALKNTITSHFESAKETIHGIVEKIKNVFNFSWSLPKIKLPHFKVGTGQSVLGINLPKISVEWYKKAYEDPIVFNRPTVMATASGLKGFGDGSGDEIVYGRDRLMRDIRDAVGGVSINPVFKLYLDGDKLVGGTSERMDGSLGQMQAYQLRWEGAV